MCRQTIEYGPVCAWSLNPRLKCTFKDACGPASLHLSHGVDGSQSMDEAHHGQRWSGQPRREDVAVETQPVAALNLQVWGQEGETVVVTRGEDHHIYLDGKTACFNKFGMEKEKWQQFLVSPSLCKTKLNKKNLAT